LAANLSVGSVFWSHAAILAYAYLMFCHFFAPNTLNRHLLLTLATHNPIVVLMLGGLLVLFAAAHGLTPAELMTAPILCLIGMYWALILSWEVARKIRAWHEEDEYITYSRIFGRTLAVLLAASVQTIALILGLHLSYSFSSFWPFSAVAGVAYINLMAEYVRFLRVRRAGSESLKRYSEAYVGAVFFAMLLTMIL
jgi:4-hydroxybenzoate polyprenyltransferase